MRSNLLPAAALALAGASPVAADTPPPAPVRTIALDSYAFAPATIVLAAGRPVTLRFVNRSSKSHDFTAPDFFRSARIVSGGVADGKIALRGRQSAAVTLVPARGTYRVHCGKPFHALFGMKARIVVS